MYEIILFKTTKNDILEIFDFIALDNVFYANKFLNNIFKTIESIKIFPYIGKQKLGKFREIIEPEYKFRNK